MKNPESEPLNPQNPETSTATCSRHMLGAMPDTSLTGDAPVAYYSDAYDRDDASASGRVGYPDLNPPPSLHKFRSCRKLLQGIQLSYDVRYMILLALKVTGPHFFGCRRRRFARIRHDPVRSHISHDQSSSH
jgi:hypothetical protein